MDRETLASLLRDTHDADPAVRRHAARELCAGQILRAFERMRDDPDPKLRRQVRKAAGAPPPHGPHQPGRALEICSPGRDTTPRRGEASA